jgi:SAM-dependent methyltransferase
MHINPIRKTTTDIFSEVQRLTKQQPVRFLENVDATGETQYCLRMLPSYERTVADLEEIFGSQRGKILEIGCFFGWVSIALHLLGHKVSAVDIPEFAENRSMRKRMAQIGIPLFGVNLRDVGKTKKLPFDDGQFDCVVFCEVLEHFNFNPLPVMSELNRVLKEEGLLYLSTPNQAAIGDRLKLARGRSVREPIRDFVKQFELQDNMIVGLHWRTYTADELRMLLKESGFGLKHLYYYSETRSKIKRLVYAMFPSWRPYIVTISRKLAPYSVSVPDLEVFR